MYFVNCYIHCGNWRKRDREIERETNRQRHKDRQTRQTETQRENPSHLSTSAKSLTSVLECTRCCLPEFRPNLLQKGFDLATLLAVTVESFDIKGDMSMSLDR